MPLQGGSDIQKASGFDLLRVCARALKRICFCTTDAHTVRLGTKWFPSELTFHFLYNSMEYTFGLARHARCARETSLLIFIFGTKKISLGRIQSVAWQIKCCRGINEWYEPGRSFIHWNSTSKKGSDVILTEPSSDNNATSHL